MKHVTRAALLAIPIACGTWLAVNIRQPITDSPIPYDNLEYGIPCQTDQIINREGYALGFSNKYKQPLWVMYRLTKEEASASKIPRTNNFMEDPLVITGSASPEDYINTGYDRGHLAPAADMYWSTNAMWQSFYMSNMAPQTPELNRKTWLFAESFTRKCAIGEESVIVVSGPVITNDNPKTIGTNNVVVPDAFYKVIFDETPPEKMLAFVMPNDHPDMDMWRYATNVIYVETITGLSFFPNLDTNKLEVLKTNVNTNDWIIHLGSLP